MKLSQFESATLIDGGKIRVKGPAGGQEGEAHNRHTPVHFAIVRDGHVLTGTGEWTDSWHWSGETDTGVAHLTKGPAYAFALEVRFWWEDAGDLESAGGYQTYAWSQEIDLQ
jgi:hypothetical protein